MRKQDWVLIALFLCVPAALLIAIWQDAQRPAQAQEYPGHWVYIGENMYQRDIDLRTTCYAYFDSLSCVRR